MGSKKIWGLFPKTCFRWNGPLHESLKNKSYFGLEFSRDWSGVDSVIESMRNLFWPFLILYRTFCVVALWHLTKFIRYRFRKLSSKKEHPKGAPFASALSVPLLRPPRNPLVNSHWYSGATVTTRWPPRPALAFSRDRGRGPVGSKEHLPFTLFMQNKSCSRKLEVRIP